MKKFILMAGAALLLAGCNQGGTSDQYGTSTGTNSSYNKGSATSPSGTNSGGGMSSSNSNAMP